MVDLNIRNEIINTISPFRHGYQPIAVRNISPTNCGMFKSAILAAFVSTLSPPLRFAVLISVQPFSIRYLGRHSRPSIYTYTIQRHHVFSSLASRFTSASVQPDYLKTTWVPTPSGPPPSPSPPPPPTTLPPTMEAPPCTPTTPRPLRSSGPYKSAM